MAEAISGPHAEAAATQGAWKSIALLLTAPRIGLVHAVQFPFAGLGMLLWMGAKAPLNRREAQ